VKDGDSIGTADLQVVLENLESSPHLMKLMTPYTPDDRQNIGKNREEALRVFCGLLYARLLIFHMFLECAAGMLGGIQEDHKHLWLFLQLSPCDLLKPGGDIFLHLSLQVNERYHWEMISPLTLWNSCIKELDQIYELIKGHLVCAVDEAAARV
jgi:hypothetical protein